MTSGDSLDATLRGFVSGQKVFNRYTLTRTLGRGGMGIVWLAHDDELDRDVALKFLPELIVHDRAILEDLKREAKRSLELTHKNIVRIHDFVHDVISGCISMEYIEGDTLSNLRADRPTKIFEPDELKPWLNQLCDALDYAHNHARIVHRDLKPANLMVSKRGQLKVSDFGIARSISDSVSRLTMERGTSGTLVYMSPQQLDGERGTHLDDIYSLGATVYELLTSKPPFYSGDVSRQIHDRTAPSMMNRRRDLEIEGNPIPRNWEETIAACLAKDPAKRPQSVSEIAGRLQLASKQTLAPVVRVKPLRKKALFIACAGAAAICIIAAAAWYFGIRATGEKASTKTPLTAGSQRPRGTASTVPPSPMGQNSEAQTTKAPRLSFASITKEHPYVNSLGMKFVRVPGTNALFSVWETRVKDFATFVEATGHKAEGGMFSLEKGGWKLAGRTWKDPGFAQTGEHAVCGVSWEDASAFCGWLTEQERQAGRISQSQSYRLPTDLEWSAAVGLEKETGSTPEKRNGKVKGVYPWGTEWPPPAGAGNYAGSEAGTGDWPSDWQTIRGYRDDYPRTSPVGSFEANRLGLYDMGGNVWQWCEDLYNAEKKFRVLRGASWRSYDPVCLLSSFRLGSTPEYRFGDLGFRCVLSELEIVSTKDQKTSAPSEPVSLSAPLNESSRVGGETLATLPSPTAVEGSSPFPSASVQPKPAVEKKSEPQTTKPAKLNFASITKEHPYVNSLGMKFVPVSGTSALFSIWETRVKDFEAFVKASGHKAEGGMLTITEKGIKNIGATWKNPGFAQTGEHAVCGVSWEDATAFCKWLTQLERKAGLINANQAYRLPRDQEWSTAVELTEEEGSAPNDKKTKVYPWGTQWPPPKGAGNYSQRFQVDEFEATSPVGSFQANRYGIYDLGGNVSEWIDSTGDPTDAQQEMLKTYTSEDWYRAMSKMGEVRGGSWTTLFPDHLLSSFRGFNLRNARSNADGFRCVLSEIASAKDEKVSAPVRPARVRECRIISLKPDQLLIVRKGPGANFPVVARYSFRENELIRAGEGPGQRSSNAGTTWQALYSVSGPFIGWVEEGYLSKEGD